MSIRHVIFDADGTLFDTEYAVSEITADLSTEKGVPVSAQEVFCTFAGKGSRDKFISIASSRGIQFSEECLSYLSRAHGERKDALYEGTIALVPGVEESLQLLVDAGVVLSVASNNSTARVQTGIDKTGLSRFFHEKVYGTDLVGDLKKPNPAVFQLAMARAGFAADVSAVVGDSEPDVLASRAAGCQMVAYLDPRFGHGAGAIEKENFFRQAGATHVIRSYAALKDCLKF